MFRNSGFFSVFVSILFHLAFIVPLVLMYTYPSAPGSQIIEIGLGNGEPEGGHAGGGVSVPEQEEEKIPVKSSEKKVVKEEKKTDVKKSDEKSEKTSTGTTTGGSGEGHGTGTGTGPGTGSGTGTGTGGLGIPTPPVEKKDETYYVAVEQMPEPIGGKENIQSKLPPSLQNSGKGTVYVLAFIDENGIVRKTLLSKGIGSPYDEAAMEAVKRSRFKAGRKQGVYVRVQYHIAINF